MRTPRELSTLCFRICALATLLGACSEELPRTEPEGGFNAFAVAVVSDSPAAFWETVSADNQRQFADALVRLKDMERVITRFQPAEQEQYRTQAGVDLIRTIDTPYALYEQVMAGVPICRGERCLQGMAVRETEMLGEDEARIRTSADQNFTVVRGEDGIWRVDQPIDAFFARSLTDVHNSYENLTASAEFFGTGLDELTELRQLGFLPEESGAVEESGDEQAP
jgi:hypothetical protein